MTDFLFYAYWNGEQVRDVFEAMAGIVGNNDFTELCAFCVLLGIVIVLAVGSSRHEGKSAITYFACTVLFWFAVIHPKGSVTVEDVRSEEVYVVDNVPLGLAFFGSVANRTGHWLSDIYETAFAPVECARFTKFGAVYPERALEALSAAGPVTPEGAANTRAVISGCVIPELVSNSAKLRSLTQSTDLWASVAAEGWVNPARTVAMPNGNLLRCPEALTALQNVYEEVELPELKKVLAAKLLPDHVDPGTTLASSLPESEGLLLGLSRSMDTSLRHAVLMRGLQYAGVDYEAGVGNPMGLAVAVSKAQGNLASEINYRTMASIAKETLPKIRNALEFIVIAAFPIVALVALVSGQAMTIVVKSYITLLLTVQLWPALASVVNHLIVTVDAQPFNRIATDFGGLTLASVGLIRETGATSQAIAGALMCMVPVISYALVRAGDLAVGQLVGGLMNPAQSAATSQGSALAAGNVTQGNVRMGTSNINTHAANKLDRSVAAVAATRLETGTAYGTVVREAGGAVTGATRTAVAVGVSQSQSEVLSRESATTASTERINSQSSISRFTIASAAVSSDSSQRGFAHALRDSLSENNVLGNERNLQSSVASSANVTRSSDWSSTNSAVEATSVKSQGAVNASLGGFDNGGMGIVSPLVDQEQMLGTRETGSMVVPDSLDSRQFQKFSSSNRYGTSTLGVQLNFQDAQTLIDTASGKVSTASQSERRNAIQRLERAADSIAKTHSDEGVRSEARQFLRSLSKTGTQAEDSVVAVSENDRTQTGLSEHRGGEVRTSTDQNVAILQEAVGRHGSPEAVLRAAYDMPKTSSLAGSSHTGQTMHLAETDAFGPGTVLPAVERAGDVYDTSQDHLARGAGSHAAGLGSIQRELGAPVVPEGPAGQQEFNARYEGKSSGLDDARARLRNDVNFERGLSLVTREAYRIDHADKNFAIRNAFLAAWGYRSGDEIAEGLRERALSNQELQKQISGIGEKQNVSLMTKDDWKQLLNMSKKD